MAIVPGTKKGIISFVFRHELPGFTDELLRHPVAVDARRVPHLSTACDRSSVQIMPDSSVHVWSAHGCTIVPEIHTAVLQRTKGGMSTYDVHLLHRGSGQVTTVELLPHSTLGSWSGAMSVYDAGADPISPDMLHLMYGLSTSWDDVVSKLADLEAVASECSGSQWSENDGSESESESEIGSSMDDYGSAVDSEEDGP